MVVFVGAANVRGPTDVVDVSRSRMSSIITTGPGTTGPHGDFRMVVGGCGRAEHDRL